MLLVQYFLQEFELCACMSDMLPRLSPVLSWQTTPNFRFERHGIVEMICTSSPGWPNAVDLLLRNTVQL